MFGLFRKRKYEEAGMKLIVGLGNPTNKYEGTRHNVGFDVIDKMADEYGIGLDVIKHKGMYGKGKIDGQTVILLKPMTFMNLSGESVSQVATYYKIASSDIIVVYDDINLDVGRLRVRGKGSAGGHNGIKNIIANLHTEEFPRVRVGVGMKPPRMDLADYVLSHFSNEDRKLVDESYDKAIKAIALLVNDELDKAMNEYNGK